MIMVQEATGEVRWTVQAHAGQGSSTSVAMSPDKKLVASVGSAEANWKLWDAASGAAGMTGARHGTGACICQVDGLDLQSFDEDCPVVAHTSGLRALAFSPCSQHRWTPGIVLQIL